MSTSVFTAGTAKTPIAVPVATPVPTPVKTRKPRFSKIRSNKNFFVSAMNANLLTAAKIIAEERGVSVVYVTGPSGWGKTRLGYEFARQIGYNVEYVAAPSVMEGEEWFGVRHVENDETIFRHTEFAKALQRGKTVIIIDELSRVAPFVLNPLLSLMHDDGEIIYHNELFRPAKGTIFYITANVGNEYTGTYELDVALESRLTVQLKVDKMPVKTEIKIVKNQVGTTEEIATAATSLIRFARKNNLSARDVSPRATIKMATLMATGIDWKYVINQFAGSIEDLGDRKQFIDFTKSDNFAKYVNLFADDEDEEEEDEE